MSRSGRIHADSTDDNDNYDTDDGDDDDDYRCACVIIGNLDMCCLLYLIDHHYYVG